MATRGDWVMKRLWTDEANGGKGLLQHSLVDFEGKRGKFSSKIADNSLKFEPKFEKCLESFEMWG